MFLTLAFGGVYSWSSAAALCAVTAVVVARALLATRRGEVELPPRWILGPLLLVWAWAAFQAVPLPPALSGPPDGVPDALEARWALLSPEAWRPLALDLGRCLGAVQKGALYILAFGLAWSLGRAGYARWFLFGLMALGCFEAFYGMLEQVSGNAETFGYAKPSGSSRASGSYVNPNHYAGFLGMALPAGIGIALGMQRGQRLDGFWLRLREGLTRPDAPKRALLVGAAFLIAVGLVASLSRGGSLAAMLGIAVLAGVGARRNRKKSLVVLAIAGGLGLWIALLGAERLTARFAKIETLELIEARGRVGLVRDTASMLGDFPLRGIGVGSYETAFPVYAGAPYGGIADHAHCDVLQALAELGGPMGLLLLICVGATYVVIARRVLRAEGPRAADAATLLACVCPLVVHSFFDFNLHLPANALWWSVLLGLGLGCTEGRAHTVQLPRGRLGVAALLLAFAAAGALVSWSAVLAARADWHARPFIERVSGDLRPPHVQALSYAEAIRIWPFAAHSHVLLGLCEWEATVREQQALAEQAARSALDPNVALESEIQQLAGEVFAQRLELPQVRAARSLALVHVARARRLAPPLDLASRARARIQASD